MWFRGVSAVVNLRLAQSIHLDGPDSRYRGDWRVVARCDDRYEPTLFAGSRPDCEALIDQLAVALAAGSTVAPSKAPAKPAPSPAPKPDRGLRTGR
jgi:hypothetical protein